VTIVQPAPTAFEIETAQLYLEHYGSSVSLILDHYPIDPNHHIVEQQALPALDAYMDSEGWHRVGSGFFSAVYAKGGLAIKVGLKTEDSGAVYAAWCRANQGRPGVPIIHAIDKFTQCYVVLMDRCYPNTIARIDNHKVIDRLQDVLYDEAIPLTALEETVDDIRQFFTGIACFDIGLDNVMLDRNLNVVVTDPVSYDRAAMDDTRADDYVTHSEYL